MNLLQKVINKLPIFYKTIDLNDVFNRTYPFVTRHKEMYTNNFKFYHKKNESFIFLKNYICNLIF
jgi:hypothetical protein